MFNIIELLLDTYLQESYNRCYCHDCHIKGGENDYKSKGEPNRIYPVPIGWCKFGLNLPPPHKDASIDALNKWHRAYHGTSCSKIYPILKNTGFLIPGDVGFDGHSVSRPPFHFHEGRKPPGFDVNQIFVSPTIYYSEHYCEEVRYSLLYLHLVYIIKSIMKLSCFSDGETKPLKQLSRYSLSLMPTQ